MLHKKMNHQNNARPSSAKRYLEDKQKLKKEKDDEPRNKTNDGCKWVKTDSECKVTLGLQLECNSHT